MSSLRAKETLPVPASSPRLVEPVELDDVLEFWTRIAEVASRTVIEPLTSAAEGDVMLRAVRL